MQLQGEEVTTPVSAPEIPDLREGPEAQAARRSSLYRVLATCFAFPSQELVRAVSAGEVRDALAEAAAGLPYPLPTPEAASGLADTGPDADTLETEYIRIFDVGMGSGPPCSLYCGSWRGDRLAVMEECLRFYQHFGLGLPEPRPELPDHLTVAMEFMHYLAFRQIESARAGRPTGDYVRAQRDFLERQVLSWFPRMAAKLASQSPPAFYSALTRFALDFFQAEKAHLAALAAAEA